MAKRRAVLEKEKEERKAERKVCSFMLMRSTFNVVNCHSSIVVITTA